MERRLPLNVKESTRQAAGRIQRETRRAIGRRRSDANRRRTDQSEKLGSWSGKLASEITFEAKRTRRGAWRVEIGPTDHAIWGWIHETGAGKYPQRPWFLPVAEGATSAIVSLFRRRTRLVLP